MSDQSGLKMVMWTVVAAAVMSVVSADELPFEEARNKDLATWRGLLAKGEFDALETIADELRATNAKYRNGRGRLWRFCWTPVSDKKPEQEADYQQSLQSLTAWLDAKPKSVNARLLLAKYWAEYAFFARGHGMAAFTSDEALKLFAERSAKGVDYLDEIDELTDEVDNAYRRLRIDLAKGIGVKPAMNLVHDVLKSDPLNMEVVHGMAICLLPRWFGTDGELEKFTEDVVRRTKTACGEMHYATTAVAVKDLLHSSTLDAHQFSWPRLAKGFRDLERQFPHSREHLDDEAQFAFMTDDLEAVFPAMKKIGDQPYLESWQSAEIHFDEFRPRMSAEMMRGGHKRLLLGHTSPVLAVEVLGDEKVVASVEWDRGFRLHNLADGKRRGWEFLDGIVAGSVIFQPKTGLLAAGFDDESGILLYKFGTRQPVEMPSSNLIVKAASFSPKGDLLAVADEAGLVVVINMQTGKLKLTFPAEDKRNITALAFSPKADQLAATCFSGDLLTFNLKDKTLEATRKISPNALFHVAWTEKHLALGSAAGETFIFDGPAGDKLAEWSMEPLEVGSLAFSPNGEKLAIGLRHPIGPRFDTHWDTPVTEPLWVWNYRQDKTPTSLSGHKLGVNCVRFADQGKTLISASNDWTVRIWDVP